MAQMYRKLNPSWRVSAAENGDFGNRMTAARTETDPSILVVLGPNGGSSGVGGEVKLVRPTALLVYRGAQNPVQRFDWVANQTFHRHPDICGCRRPQPVQMNEWMAC